MVGLPEIPVSHPELGCTHEWPGEKTQTTGEYRTRANDATEAAFRTAVVNGFSPKTRESLNSVIGLGEMGQRAWEQAVVHHVTREAKKETEDDKEELELKRRLLRMDVKNGHT